MKRADVVQQIKFHNEEIAFLSKLATNCSTCIQFDVTACKLYGEVPGDFQRVGCDEWEFDPAPF